MADVTTQNRYEKPGSRRRWFSGIDTLNETRTYYVLGIRPDQVFIDAWPPLPPYGSQLPTEDDTRNPSDGQGLTVRQYENLTLRQFIFDHEGGPTGADSAITLVYSTAPWIIEPTVGTGEGITPRRVVHWTSNTSLESEQVSDGWRWPAYEDFEPLSAPTSRVRPVQNMTATLEGTHLTTFMVDATGRVNDEPFRTYGAGDVLYMGADSELEGGFDTAEPFSISTIRLKFAAKIQHTVAVGSSQGDVGFRVGGWDRIEPNRRADGTILASRVYGIYRTTNFAELFPPGWVWNVEDFRGGPDDDRGGPRDDGGDDENV